MTQVIHKLTTDALDYLLAIARDESRPREAKGRLRDLQAAHPQAAIELVWQEEAYDHSVHYDVIMHAPGVTISVGACREHVLPWPLRGVHRWKEADLLKVNESVMSVQQAVACLGIGGDASIASRLIEICLMQEEFERNPVALTDAELQAGLDAFRRAHRLYSVEDTEAWLTSRGIAHSQLESLVADNLAIETLRDRVSHGGVGTYFEAHRASFDVARVAQIACGELGAAQDLLRRIGSGEVDFYQAAEEIFARGGANVDVRMFAVLRRGEVSEDVKSTVFSARPGDLVGPLRVGSDHVVMTVLSLTPACLDAQTELLVKRALFDQWLANRRRAARIEWHWGSSAQATSTGA